MIIPFIKNINFYELLKFKSLFGKSDPMKDYIPIAYLQSTGTQYIDTGVKYDNHYHYIIDCEIDSIPGNQLFGMLHFYDHSVVIWDNYHYYLCNGERQRFDSNIIGGNRAIITIDYDDKSIAIKSGDIDTVKVFTGDFNPSSSVYPVILFAYWTSWSDKLSGYGKGKIYSFKYYESDELLRDMVPVIRKSDNKPGMYDKVSQTFLINQGTGEFTVPV